jgi:hypothetical protein
MTIEQYPSSNNIASTVIWKYTGQGTETVLSGTDSFGQVLNFTPGSEQLFLNGVLLVRTQDYTPAANGLSITLPSQLAYGDFVQIYCYSNYSISTVASSAITGAVQNTQLANSGITIGNQTIGLGQSITIPTGLTLSGSTNTFSNIPNSALTNSTIIVNGNPISLGASVNITTPNTILADKGGLIVGTGGGSVTQLSVGADGTVPLADSSKTSGINWSGPHNIAGKNLILNGGFDSWSLGTSFTTDLSYTADRWYSRIIGAQSITQETSDLPSTNTRYGLKWNTTASTSGFSQIHYPLDSATTINLRGKVVTFSFYAKVSGGYAGNIGPEVKYSNSIADAGYINGATSITISSGGFAAPTTWTRLSYTFTVPTDAVSLYVGIVPDTAQSISGQTVRLANVQLEVGSTATNFTKAFSTSNGDVAIAGPSGYDGILASTTPTTASAQGNPPKLNWAGYNVAGKNFVINGGMEFAQRGASLTGIQGYNLDRWYLNGYGTTNNYTCNQLLVSGVIPGLRYYMRVASTTTSTQNFWLSQSIETNEVIRFAGQTVTLSFYYRMPTNNFTGNWTVGTQYSTGTDAQLMYPASSTAITAENLTNTIYWTRYTKTFFVPATATSFCIQLNSTNNVVNSALFDITGVQLELGSTATQFSRAGGTYDGELKLCQRYYIKKQPNTSDGYYGNMMVINSTSTAMTTIAIANNMRTRPIFSFANLSLLAAGSTVTISSLNNYSDQLAGTMGLYFNLGSTLPIGTVGFIYGNTTSYMIFDSEIS